jgi:hypothetical protein
VGLRQRIARVERLERERAPAHPWAGLVEAERYARALTLLAKMLRGAVADDPSRVALAAAAGQAEEILAVLRDHLAGGTCGLHTNSYCGGKLDLLSGWYWSVAHPEDRRPYHGGRDPLEGVAEGLRERIAHDATQGTFFDVAAARAAMRP